MSSTQQTGIPLLHFPTDQTYKLLELPPDLLALLESSSSSSSDTNPPAQQQQPLRLEPTPTAGLLRAPDGKTWSLQQKNTSNALVLLQAHTDDADGTATLRAVATAHETVELVPQAVGAEAPTVAARGRWHEKFGRAR